jgi:hypothetical protein
VSTAPTGGLSIETRRLRESKPAKQASPGLDELTCSLDAEYPAVKGLPSAVEARINALLWPNGPLLESDCDVAKSYEIRYQIALKEAGWPCIPGRSTRCARARGLSKRCGAKLAEPGAMAMGAARA